MTCWRLPWESPAAECAGASCLYCLCQLTTAGRGWSELRRTWAFGSSGRLGCSWTPCLWVWKGLPLRTLTFSENRFGPSDCFKMTFQAKLHLPSVCSLCLRTACFPRLLTTFLVFGVWFVKSVVKVRFLYWMRHSDSAKSNGLSSKTCDSWSIFSVCHLHRTYFSVV